MNEISVRPRTPPPLPKPPPPTRSHPAPPAADDARRPCEDQPEYHPPPRLSPPSAPAAPPTRCLTFHSPCAQACTTRSSRWSRPRSPRRSRVRTQDTPTLHMPPLRVHKALSAAPLPHQSAISRAARSPRRRPSSRRGTRPARSCAPAAVSNRARVPPRAQKLTRSAARPCRMIEAKKYVCCALCAAPRTHILTRSLRPQAAQGEACGRARGRRRRVGAQGDQGRVRGARACAGARH